MTKTRTSITRVLLTLMSLLLTVTPAFAQQNFDEVEITTTKLTENVYMLIGRGGNIGVSVGEDGVVLIDDQYAPLTRKIKAAVSAISDQPIRFVVNTHWHGDHTGGNENLGESGAVIVAHENVRSRLSTEQFMSFFDSRTPPAPDAARPVVTFTKDVTLHLNTDDLHIFHVENAHTAGDSLVHWRVQNVIHAGDLYFASQYPFIDLDSGGGIDGVITGIERALELANDSTKIIPGHGNLSNKKDLTTYRDMLKTIRIRIQNLIKEGKSFKEILSSKPTAEFDAKWGTGFIEPDVFVEFVYQSLSN